MSEFSGGFQILDLRSASEHEYSCLGEFKNILNQEYYPNDPPIPLEEQIQGWKNIPAFVELESAVLWDSANTKIIGNYDTAIYHTGDNEHAADFRIEVLPEFRCKGLGHEMLKRIVSFAKKTTENY